MSWIVPVDAQGRPHVVPKDDLREHFLVEDCWCHPRPIEDGRGFLHNPKDGREGSKRKQFSS